MWRSDLRTSIVIAVGILLPATAGCIRLFGEVPRAQPDPLSNKAVHILGVAGATCTLADGRRFDLAGVNLGGLTAEQRAEFENELRVSNKELRVSNAVVLVDDLGGGRARLVLSASHLPRQNFESVFPVITLIPIWVDEYPNRVDLAAELVRRGLARADPRGLANVRPLSNPSVGGRAKAFPEIMPGESYPDMLQQAEDEARKEHRGVFQGPAELLQIAVQRHDRARLAKLLEDGADVNAVSRGATALSVACQYGHVDLVPFLLDHGASPNVPGIPSPYDLGAAHQDVILVLLQRGVPLPGGEAATRVLINSVQYGDLLALELALKQGADPNGSISTWTPLMYAVAPGRPEAVRLLLQYGAGPTRKNGGGQTPLDMAKNDPEMRAILQVSSPAH